MEIPTTQLEVWSKDLDRQINAIQGRISAEQEKLAELQRKKTALGELIGNVDGAGRGKRMDPSQPSSQRSDGADHAPYTDYWVPILEVLHSLGGKGHVEEILPKVKDYMEEKKLLGPDDYKDVPSGSEERWRNTARWQRKAMVDRGLLRSDSPRGIWEITQEGRAWLQKRNP